MHAAGQGADDGRQRGRQTHQSCLTRLIQTSLKQGEKNAERVVQSNIYSKSTTCCGHAKLNVIFFFKMQCLENHYY